MFIDGHILMLQVLRNIIKSCLQKCHTLGKKSIAFPAIGTGILGFPHKVAAKIFFEETKRFEKTVSQCKIKEVSFVLYNQDVKSIQAFQNELKNQVEFNEIEELPDKSQTRYLVKPGQASSSYLVIQVGDDKKIEIVQGDITQESTDVIAYFSNPSLSMESGVRRKIMEVGGKVLDDECKLKLFTGKPKIGDTVLTNAGNLKAKCVAHMIAPYSPNYKDIEQSVEKCLKEIDGLKFESVSLPAVETGNFKNDLVNSANAILSPVIGFFVTNSSSLATVRIGLQDEEMFSAFKAVAKNFEHDDERGIVKKLMRYVWKSLEKPTVLSVVERKLEIDKKIYLVIYGNGRKVVDDAKDKIKNFLKEQTKTHKIESEIIDTLSKQQLDMIQRICRVRNVNAKVDQRLCRIILSGHADNVFKAVHEIFQYFKFITKENDEQQIEDLFTSFSKLVAQTVQWCYETSNGEEEEYDIKTNAIIEHSYSKNKKSVIFMFDGDNHEIVFHDMQMTNLTNNATVNVTRKRLQSERDDIAVPDYWDPQPVDASNKEVEVHLVKLMQNNPRQKDEYDKITSHFQQTEKKHKIIEIQRVQNPSLFKQYFFKRKSLDEKNGSNEMFLFHGTRFDTVHKINKKNFNRAFAGSENAVYGKGVYFAKNASMSVGYASACSSGKRYLYCARVAVGEYTLGKSDMVAPPQKNQNESYESTVNDVNKPTIFVLFHDSQYYPEYLITVQ
ncbi:protein mono-ADP-ribosyltransferase PARP14-like [Xenia sp. Carnegie-2017]|uniref:protein mono-ADP-ribosyltransferase PARP14-like n=1 Tax=Xenia sp. Carnegie-2017 TaxID=2897299 RepID=UPI001F049094|nr:protein mono-ADP-ribosyltransferase PARP14-like [Xenia sp. Carnegie-2017]